MNTYSPHINTFKLTGTLIFDPDNVTKKHERQSSWKRSAIVFIKDDDITEYYAWFIRKRYNLDLSTPLRKTHFTIINDRIQDKLLLRNYNMVKKRFNGKKIELEYNPESIKFGRNHIWLDVKCKMGEQIRVEVGLNSKPYFDFHITIGRPHEKQMSHYEIIKDLISGNFLSASNKWVKNNI